MSRTRFGRLLASGAAALAVAVTPVVAFPSTAYAATQCSDGIDNDLDGNVDYPADPGCASSADTSESVACSTSAAGVTSCVGISPSSTIQRVRVYDYDIVDGTQHTVAGYVDIYRFTLPGGTIVNLPCVVLRADGVNVNPCAENDGTFVNRVSTLLDETVAEPVVQQGAQIVTAAVCNGELVATVNGVGIASARAYTTC